MNCNERRRFPRYETEVGVTVFTEDSKISATLIDISKAGIGIISEEDIEMESEILISFKFIDDYSIQGTIKWSTQFYYDQNIYYQMGVEVESILVTQDMKDVGFPERSEIVAKILSGI
ncbi:PilZ domain-containing protein [Thermodesulfobacteriota bacterium]